MQLLMKKLKTADFVIIASDQKIVGMNDLMGNLLFV